MNAQPVAQEEDSYLLTGEAMMSVKMLAIVAMLVSFGAGSTVFAAGEFQKPEKIEKVEKAEKAEKPQKPERPR